MASAPKASFKLIVSLDGVTTPLYSGTLFALKSALDEVQSVVASLLPDANDNLSIVVIQLTSAPPAPDPEPSPSPLILTDQDGNILVWP